MVKALTGRVIGSIRGAARTAIFLLKVLPILPSRPIDWVTRAPVRKRVCYPTRHGLVEGDLTLPRTLGPHPAALLCLGVVPFDKDHPQVPRLQDALARAGYSSLLHWSPAMRDYRLDPGDIEDLALAYDWLISQPGIDPDRSGLIGTCVGGAFTTMAAAHPLIRDRVAFAFAFAPYASMRTLARDIATATCTRGGQREPWAVDPLTRKVYVHSLTSDLEPAERDELRTVLAEPSGEIDPRELSPKAQVVYPLLARLTAEEAEAALDRLPVELGTRLDAMSPLCYLPDLRAPLIVLMHDHDDPVIPISESEQLRNALANRPGVHFTEFTMFRHMDPTKVKLRTPQLLRELTRFAAALYPIFRQSVA